MSDEAVAAATGRTWVQWVQALDTLEAHKLAHKPLAELLHREFQAGDWWAQMVAVGYERIKGNRVKNQKADGFSVSASKSIAAPVATVYQAIADQRRRKAWLGSDWALRTSQENKSLRLDGPVLEGMAGQEGIAVLMVYAKGDAKTTLTVEHNKLASAERHAHWKAFWSDALARLKQKLEK